MINEPIDGLRMDFKLIIFHEVQILNGLRTLGQNVVQWRL